MFECLELVADRRVDSRLAVPEQVDPPRADRIEEAPAVEVIEPGALSALDGYERQELMMLHLRARVPHRFQAAAQELLVCAHKLKRGRTSRCFAVSSAVI